MIIWVASFPRSGNTYFRVLLKHYFGLDTYSIYEEPLLPEQSEARRLVGHVAKPLPLPDMAHASETYIVKTHEWPRDDAPAIYLVRDGRDALLSYARYILSFERDLRETAPSDAFLNILYDLIVRNASFGGWGPHVLAWTQRRAPTAILSFETLVRTPDPDDLIRKALTKIGFDPGEQNEPPGPPPSFEMLHEKAPAFFREGKIGVGQTEMPADLQALFWEYHGTAMRKMGYTGDPRSQGPEPNLDAAAKRIAAEKGRDDTVLQDAQTAAPNLLRFLAEKIALDVFVEVGSYLDNMPDEAPFPIPSRIPVKRSARYIHAARSRSEIDVPVAASQDDSVANLADLADQLKGKAICYGIDAHRDPNADAPDAASSYSLLDDLTSIGRLNTKSVILINNARSFLSPSNGLRTPQLGFSEIWQGLRQLSKNHELIVIRDVIVYFPKRLKKEMNARAHAQDTDWESPIGWSRAYDTLLQEAQAKEHVINGLHEAAVERLQRMHLYESDLKDKESVIQAKDEELADRETLILQQRAILEAKEEELADKETLILRQQAILEAKDEKLADRETLILQQRAILEAKDEELADEETLLSEKDAVIRAKNAALADSEVLILSQREMIGARDEELAEQEATIASKVEEVEKREATLVSRTEQLIAKEAVIQDQHRQLLEKEAVIQALELFRRSSLRYWVRFLILPSLRRALHVPLRLLRWPLRALRAALRPRLGNLNQHPPIPLRLPRRYHTVTSRAATSPKISVVTPSYNQAAFLERTLQSVLEQSYPHLEYIVQDGGSTDGTDAILDRYKAQCSHVDSRQDRGQAHAINLGFSHATGSIMAWLNSDDLLLPGALAYVANYFARHPEVDVVYGHRILIDDQDQEIGRWILPAHDDAILKWADYVPQETLFWRRSIWEKAGGRIDESFQFALDWDLLLRFQEAGARFACLPRFLGAFRIYSEQKTQDWEAIGQQEMMRLRARANGREVDWPEINDNIQAYLRRSSYLHLLYRAKLLRL